MLHEVRKTLYTMNLHLHMHLDVLHKMDRYLKDISKNIVLTYEHI